MVLQSTPAPIRCVGRTGLVHGKRAWPRAKPDRASYRIRHLNLNTLHGRHQQGADGPPIAAWRGRAPALRHRTAGPNEGGRTSLAGKAVRPTAARKYRQPRAKPCPYQNRGRGHAARHRATTSSLSTPPREMIRQNGGDPADRPEEKKGEPDGPSRQSGWAFAFYTEAKRATVRSNG